jgi:hypothetical protein
MRSPIKEKMLASCHSRTGSGGPEPAAACATEACGAWGRGPEHANRQTASDRTTKRCMTQATVREGTPHENPAC